jgi:hypothetical protein
MEVVSKSIKINRFDNDEIISKIFKSLKLQDVVFTFFHFEEIEMESADSIRDYRFQPEILEKLYLYLVELAESDDDPSLVVVDEFLEYLENKYFKVM